MDKCKVCKKCGGCNIDLVNYKETLNEKTNEVKKILKFRIDKNVKVEETIGMENPYNYRNKGKYVFGQDLKTKDVAMGFFKEGTHDIVSTSKCAIQNEVINEVAEYTFSLIKKYKISIYNEDTRKGILRHLIIKYGIKSKEIMVILVTVDAKISRREQIVKELVEKFPNIKTIVQNINDRETNAILGNKNIKLFGNGYIVDYLEKNKFKISPLSFYQVNPVQTEILYNKAIEFANLTGQELVYDLYSGIGTISLFISKKARKVFGIEIVKDAVIDAKENAKLNKINNVEFYAGKVEIVLPKMYQKGKTPDVIFVDPPRSGLDDKTIETLLYIKPRKIVYISCNPYTLGENIDVLNKSYKVTKVQPVDMFPFTTHVETITLMTRCSETAKNEG